MKTVPFAFLAKVWTRLFQGKQIFAACCCSVSRSWDLKLEYPQLSVHWSSLGISLIFLLSGEIHISHCLATVHAGIVIRCLGWRWVPRALWFQRCLMPPLLAFLPGLGWVSTDPKWICPQAYQGAPAERERVYKPVKKHPSFGAWCMLASPSNSVPPLLRGAAFLLCFGWLMVSRCQLFSSHITGNVIPASGALGSRMEKRKSQSVRVRRGSLWDA